MKGLFVGLGSFGLEEIQRDLKLLPEISWAIVDINPHVLDGLDFKFDLYPSIEEGLETVKPDFVYNATPPSVHPEICYAAFDRQIPVLTEKPLANTFPIAQEMVKRAKEKNVPFMVAENYRRWDIMRTVNRELENGTIGDLTAMHASIFMDLYTEKEYFNQFENPMLKDVMVHYTDLFRFFTACEAVNVYAKNWNPIKRYPGNAAAALMCEMESGVIVTLHGSVVTPGEETQWAGFWRFEGTKGSLHIDPDLRMIINKQSTHIDKKKYEKTILPLADFIGWLKGGPQPDTIADDYLRSEYIITCAEESFRKGEMVKINFKE